MSYSQRHTVAVTTATSGTTTGYTPVVTGRVAAIAYTKPTGTPFASTVDFTITTENSAQTVWTQANQNASATKHPVAAASLPSGAASTLTEVPIYAANERVKIGITNGGAAKTGTFTVLIA